MNASKGLVAKVERRRRRVGLSQVQVASQCGMSQGHYSKLVAGLPAGAKARAAMLRWLGDDAPARRGSMSKAERAEAQRLLEVLAQYCRRLAALIDAV